MVVWRGVSTIAVWAVTAQTLTLIYGMSGGAGGSDWGTGQGVERTYVLTNCYWWESLDHQLTTIFTLLSIAQNTSSIAVLPTIPSAKVETRTNMSVIGDYFDLGRLRQVQPVMTFTEFAGSKDFEVLRGAEGGSVMFPKESHEEYELKLGMYGGLDTGCLKLDMPNVDPENTNQMCNSFSGTVHTSADGSRRFVFLDRLHFLHFCTERFMPWWYDVRHHVLPRREFVELVSPLLDGLKRPLTVVHVNDVMESQRKRDDVEIERYARQIVDALRVNEALGGSKYVMYNTYNRNRQDGNVGRVVRLLRDELEAVHDCEDVYGCLRRLPRHVADASGERLFGGELSGQMVDWSVAMGAEVFVGNIHSPLSRNVALVRKTLGRRYSMVRGFAELRKVWAWNLR